MFGTWRGGNKQRHEAIIDGVSSAYPATSSFPGLRRLLIVAELQGDN